MKNNKSKFEGIKKSFKQGAKQQLEFKGTYVAALVNGVLKSDKKVTKGIAVGCTTLVAQTVVNGAFHVAIDLIVPTNKEEIVED